ncbi:retrovirus-related Pol polyprotein from transposon opus [Trichonephila clavipes]|nr:retrovirus-related Pol polyprotein from transposon opus [Trichonephila clavipes]
MEFVALPTQLTQAPAFIVEQPFPESTPRRVVIDYSRTINSITKLDPHPIDHMDDVIKRIVGKCYISKMDVKSAFNTIRIRETDIFKTGFVTPDGHYKFLRMPFGVTNGPSLMTRAIKFAYKLLAPHNVNTCIDDISTFHDDFSYHLKVLYKILEATRNAGFKLTPGKTQLALSEIALFVRNFLGFTNQFRKHIQNYAVIAKPLTSVLKGLERRTTNATITLTDDQQRTFGTLKTAITTAPILAYFKQGLTTFLETDASYLGLGAVLSQDHNGKRRVFEYASRTLKDAETRYHSNELECTPVHWALTEKFRLYLLGHKFQLITDNYTTAYVVAKSTVNRKFARYLVDLAQFDFTTVHRPGKQNVIADHLSRFPTPPVCLTVTASHQSEICAKQKQDDFYQYIFCLIKEQNPNKKSMSIISNYNINNNTLMQVSFVQGRRFRIIRLPKQGDHKLSPIFKGPFVIVRPVRAVCYEIKSRTLQNKFIKVVHVQHLRPYFKRDADVMQNNTSDEEDDSSAENQDPAEEDQEVSVTTEPSSS